MQPAGGAFHSVSHVVQTLLLKENSVAQAKVYPTELNERFRFRSERGDPKIKQLLLCSLFKKETKCLQNPVLLLSWKLIVKRKLCAHLRSKTVYLQVFELFFLPLC